MCDVPGETFLELYLTRVGGLGGAGIISGSDYDTPSGKTLAFGGERIGRRGGLTVSYNTSDREESVKGEECDFICTAAVEPVNQIPLQQSAAKGGMLRTLAWTMPMSELYDQCEQDKSWKIRQSLLSRYGNVKCLTRFRDAHIYFFPRWVKEFAALHDDFESVSEDLVGTWAKSQWRKPSYRAAAGFGKLFALEGKPDSQAPDEIPIEDEIDLLSLSSTQTTQHILSSPTSNKETVRLASRVHANRIDAVLSTDKPMNSEKDEEASLSVPPVLTYIHSSAPNAPLIRRIDTTPLLLSVSLLLAKIPAVEESLVGKIPSSTTPYAHALKVAPTASIAQKVTISRSDCLIDSNTTVATQCVIKTSVIGASVSIGTGTRLTNCLVMEGATIGEKCVLTGTVVGKKANIGRGCTLQNCEVQDGNAVPANTEGKGEKYLIGGLEDDMAGEDDGIEDLDENPDAAPSIEG